MRKTLTLLLLSVIAIFNVHSAGEPRAAVIPFNAIGISEQDAQVLSGLFETALVKTQSFSVIEQNQVKEIVEAQSYSLSGCTDEACAIEFGELLSAEQIILGDVSMIGGKYIINAKIIDVGKGRNIKADTVEAKNIAEMTSAAELLAFKLAGLTLSSSGTVEVAREFGEVLIATEPPGADIFINGVHKGVSPELIDRIPIGRIKVEAKTDGLYASRDVTVSAETGQLTLTLEKMYGNIFLKSSVSNAEVYLDGMKYGDIGNGFIKDVSVGSHRLEVWAVDSFWEGTIEVENGVSTRTDVYLRPFGVVRYNLPSGVYANLVSREKRYSIRGNGTTKVICDTYQVTARGGMYEIFEDNIQIRQGQTLSFNPDLHTVKELEEKHLKDKMQVDIDRIEKCATSVEVVAVLSSIDVLIDEIEGSEHSFPALLSEARDLHDKASMKLRVLQNQEKIILLESQKTSLEIQLETLKKIYAPRNGMGFLYTGLGVVIGSFAIFYDDIIGAIIEDWEPTDDFLTYYYPRIMCGIGVVGCGVLAYMNFKPLPGDNRSELRKSIRQLDKEIKEAKMQ